MHISEFSQETQDLIYELCFRARMRAIKNGTYPPKEAVAQTGTNESTVVTDESEGSIISAG